MVAMGKCKSLSIHYESQDELERGFTQAGRGGKQWMPIRMHVCECTQAFGWWLEMIMITHTALDWDHESNPVIGTLIKTYRKLHGYYRIALQITSHGSIPTDDMASIRNSLLKHEMRSKETQSWSKSKQKCANEMKMCMKMKSYQSTFSGLRYIALRKSLWLIFMKHFLKSKNGQLKLRI